MKGGNFKQQFFSAVNAVTQQVASGAKAASKFVQQEALGASCLLDYHVGQQLATAGSGHALWRIYTARSKKEGSLHPVVSAWILDKRELIQTEEQLYGGHSSGGGGGGGGLTRPSQRRLEALLEQCRHDVHALARLKHPSVLRLIAPLEETRTQLVFITEPVFSSLHDLLGAGGGSGPVVLPPALAQERRALRLSELEMKHGLLQLADGLHFLHTEAGLVHKGVCPSAVVITAAGTWKLAGFAFSAPLDYSSPEQHRAFDYSSADPSLLQTVTQPPLPYVAPELVASGSTSITGAADVFSLGALTYELLTRRQLLPVGHSLADYESRVHSLTLVDMAGVPMGLEQTLRSMLAPVAGARTPAAAVAGCQYFQGDVLLRALKFLDTMLQREAVQKAGFLRDLPAMCAQFDGRVLRYLVLPPLLQELRDVTLQPVLLPIVLNIVQQQDPAEFADATLPALKPLLASASGDTLLLLVQNAELLHKCMPPAAAAKVLPALLVRAAEHGDARAQEEMLKRVAAMADSLDYEALKAAVLPAVHALCLGTTSASVRVSAFAAMSRLVQRMDQAEAEAMLATASKVSAVDRSAPTAMCVLALGAALARQHGARLAAERVLPTLSPLLVAPTLNSQQFGTAMKTMREVLAAIEKSRGDGGSTAVLATAGSGGAMPGRPSTAGSPSGGTASAATDWLAATAVEPLGSSSARSTASSGSRRPVASASAAAFHGGDPLAGLQLQPASAKPSSAAAAGSSGGGGGSGFGLVGGRVGSGKATRLGTSGSTMAAPPATSAQPSWAFGGTSAVGNSSSSSIVGGGGPGMQLGQSGGSSMRSGGGMGAVATASNGLGGIGGCAASLSDPFAGLQLGSSSHNGNTSGGSMPWSAPASQACSSAAAFDPFALGNSSTSAGLGSGASMHWPAPAQLQPQQQQRPSGGVGGSSNGWPGGSLI